MKKIFLGLAFMSTLNMLACDICNIYMGVNPNDYKNSIGFYYRSRFLDGIYSSTSVVNSNSPFRHFGNLPSVIEENSSIKEIYNVYELRGVFYFNPKWSILANVPVVNNYRGVDGYVQTDVWGMSDPVVIARYQMLSTKETDSTNYTHRLLGGIGMKLPFGAFEKTYNNELVDEDMQPGSGSLDFIFMLEYMIRFNNNLGVSSNASFKINTQNYTGYKFGNAINISTNLFYQAKLKKGWSIVPSIGAYWESASKDYINTEKINDSGGEVLFNSLGLDVYYKNLSLRSSYQLAVYNQLEPSRIPVKDRWTVGLFYTF